MRLGLLSFRSSPAVYLGLDSLVTNWEVLPGKNWLEKGRPGREEPKPRILLGKVPGRVTWVQSCRVFWPQSKPHLTWDEGLSLEGVNAQAHLFSTLGRPRRFSEPGGSP